MAWRGAETVTDLGLTRGRVAAMEGVPTTTRSRRGARFYIWLVLIIGLSAFDGSVVELLMMAVLPMLTAFVLTAEPVETAPLPVAPIELVARLRAACALTALAAADFAAVTTVPATALVACEPPTEPPDVLT